MHTYKPCAHHSLFRIHYPLRHVVCTSSRLSLGHQRSPTVHAVSRRSFFTYSVRRLLLERVEVAHSTLYNRPLRPVSSSSLPSKGSSAGNGRHGGSGIYGEDVTGKTTHRAFGEGNSSSNHLANTPTSRNTIQPMRTLSFADAECFFFRDDNDNDENREKGIYSRASSHSIDQNASSLSSSSSAPFCLLCREYLEPPANKRTHIISGNRATHLNHTCREVVLDSLALLAIRGYSIDTIYEVWSDALYRHEAFFRIKSLVSPVWSIERRAEKLSQLLLGLKEAGVLDLSLAGVSSDTGTGNDTSFHVRRRIAFERLEYIGDNAWGTHISSRMMIIFPDQQWQYSDRAVAFNCFRDACEMNVLLEEMFDVLHFARLHPSYAGAKIGSGKVKADILEALIGELHVNVWGLEPKIYDDTPFVEVNDLQESRLVSVIKHCLTEIYDLIILYHSRGLSWNAIPLAKELAVRQIWKCTMPSLQRHKVAMRRGISRAVVECIDFSTSTSPPTPTTTTTTSNGTNDLTTSKDGEGASQGLCAVSHAQITPRANLRPVANIRLPALLALSSSPERYPRVVKHPLRALPLEKLPQSTIAEHTRQDVFAYLHQSFERLDLLSEDAFQIFNRVEGAEWGKYILQLVPHIAAATAALLQSPSRRKDDEHSCTSPGNTFFSPSPNDVEQENNNGSSAMENPSAMGSSGFFATPIISAGGFSDLYFRDPYYDLFDSPRSLAEAHASHSRQPFRRHGSMRLPLVSIFKCTDAYAIAKGGHRQQEKEEINDKEGEDLALSMARNNAYPPLIQPSLLGSENGKFLRLPGGQLFSSSQRLSSLKPCLFRLSKYVPEGIKTPIGGVVTDKNLYFGKYAFLAYGKSNPLRAEDEFDASQRDHSEGLNGSIRLDVKYTEFNTLTELNHAVGNTSSGNNDGSLPEDDKMEQSNEKGCVEKDNQRSSDKNGRGFSSIETAREYWLKWAKTRRLQNNNFFK